ncbi:UDP-N-acetylmuramoyl-L-alanine--D-glutamate ligase [Nocardioides sp. TF02-7]|nr:UDP-N-acetylmuramoyl-L-alanine--D-glutamate ligase [Nocardioides sp. TF02-7]
MSAHLSALGIPHDVVVPDEEDGPDPQVAYGDRARSLLLAAEVAVKSPGIPVTSPLYGQVVAGGTVVTSLTDLWMSDNAPRTVAVTGSKGKSTTASLLSHVLDHAGRRASLRGNIGTSVLEEPDPPSELVVMELSSYQAQSLTVSPRVLVVTSLFPEHLTWHGSEEAYYRDKLNAAAHGPEVVVVPGSDDALLARVRAAAPGAPLLATGRHTVGVTEDGAVVWADGTRVDRDDLPLLGRHQAVNIALAALAAQHLGVAPDVVAAAVRTFRALPHRMERVPSADHRTWIDDSLATAPEAVVASLASLPDDRVALLVGGADRGLDFTPLTDYLARRPDVTVLLVGPAGRRVHDTAGVGRLFASFADAVTWARSGDNPASVVLLSPGAPSFDEFESYEQRSAAFRAAAAAR